MQHNHGKQRKSQCQHIAIHQQHTDVHKIKAKEGRVAAEGVYAGGDQLRFVRIRDPCPPAVLHAQDGKQEYHIAQHSGAEAGEPCACREQAPAEGNGNQLRSGGPQRRNAHEQLNRADGFFFSSPDLPGLDAAPLLRQHFGKIDAIEDCQHKQRQQGIGELFFQGKFHIFPLFL